MLCQFQWSGLLGYYDRQTVTWASLVIEHVELEVQLLKYLELFIQVSETKRPHSSFMPGLTY